jgi:HPt (histidine-containing phosphotransfer) domain-containing protein
VRSFEALSAFDEEHKAEVLAELVDLFDAEAKQSLGEANQALRHNDLATLTRVGHRLKSACGAIGAERMRALAIDLEGAAENGGSAEASRIVHGLAIEYHAVLETLRPYRLLKEDRP